MAFTPIKSQGPGGFISGAQQNSQNYGTQLKNSIFPLTVRCLKTMTKTTGDNSLTLFGEKIEKVTLVGQVLKMEQTETATSFLLDDGTGTCWMQIWGENENSESSTNAMEIDAVKHWLSSNILPYVKCYGSWANFSLGSEANHQHNLTLYRIKCIGTFNEVTFHNLRVCETLHYLEQKQNNPGNSQANFSFNNSGLSQKMQQNLNFQSQATQANYTSDQKTIIVFLQQHKRPEGISVDSIIEGLPQVDAAEIRKILSDFESEGLVYTGLDEEHFAWCEE